MNALWTPSLKNIEDSQLTQFQAFLKKKYQVETKNYASLYDWSIKENTLFWAAIAEFFQLTTNTQKSNINKKTGPQFYQTTWFENTELNFAEKLLNGPSNGIALTFINESETISQLTYPALKNKVARLSNAMRDNGIKKGDRIAGLMPNCLESVIAMLATTTLGAIWSSCSPDFGFQGVLDRFGQIKPKLLFTVDGYQYNGKKHDCLAKIPLLIKAIDSIDTVIVCPFNTPKPILSPSKKTILFEAYLSDELTLTFEPLSFNHPLYILYSSGTTGAPKCIVHSVGGTLIQHLKELSLHTNLTHKDTFFFFTTCGWMMWNWMISSLALGTHIILYEGSPTYQRTDHLFKLVDQFNVSVFGCGAKYLDSVEKAGCTPKEHYDFSALKTLLSTGSPLSHHSFDFVYQNVKSELQLSSISGGTDIISCFALGNPTLPVYRGELQCLGLGLKVAVYNKEGSAVTQEKGELVCQMPFPCMPLYFWNDKDNKKYHAAYFNRFKDCWSQGDYAEITKHKGLIIYGRADATLNPGGVRIGTAEIYRQVEKIDGVLDSIVIGQPWQNDERVLLFVQLEKGLVLDETLIKKIKQQIRQNTTPRHVPEKIITVTAIPRTLSGKVVEITVKKIVSGEAINNIEALANPEVLAQFHPKNWDNTP